MLGYFGALSAVFRGVARIMGEGSLFAFSVEAHEGRGSRLTESGRYVHSRRYIQLLTGAAGLRAVSLTDETLRHEYGEPVTGDIWVLEKPV